MLFNTSNSMYTVLQQMKHVFCKRLAACLCMQQSPSPSPEPSLLKVIKRTSSVATGDSYSNIPDTVDTTTPGVSAPKNKTRDKLLQDILDHLAAQRRYEEEQCYEADKENEMKNDWLLAAAVIDRICAIAFAIIFIGGTLGFFFVFRTRA